MNETLYYDIYPNLQIYGMDKEEVFNFTDEGVKSEMISDNSLLVFMNPFYFNMLAVQPPSYQDLEFYENKIKNNEPIKPLLLQIKNGEIIGHEGRHRSKASKNLKVNKIPVILEFVDHKLYTNDSLYTLKNIRKQHGKEFFEGLSKIQENINIPQYCEIGNQIKGSPKYPEELGQWWDFFMTCDFKPQQDIRNYDVHRSFPIPITMQFNTFR